ncbi:MAG: DUF6782 family putative metallopeptidase [Alphaproteobacteria bacterium]
MGFFSNLFKKAPEEPAQPEPPKTRKDLENTLSINELNYVQVNIGNGTLQQAFQQKRSPQEEEKKLLSDVFDLISSVPEGKKLVDDVSAMGFTVHFDAFRGNMDGCMYGKQKHIMLCPCSHSSVAALAATAFHEMTHAVQNEKSGQLLADGANLNIADQFKFQRAAEAAAWTEEAKFAYQIKDKYPEVLKHVEQFPMYQAFAGEMEKSGDMTKAGETAFKTWYGYKHYQNFYENQHVSNISNSLTTHRLKEDKKAMQGTISSEDVLDYVFISEDVKKKIDPEFLTSKEAFSISQSAVQKLDKEVKNYTSYVWKAQEDKSHHNMYSYESGQTYTAMEQNESATASLSAAHAHPSLMSALQNQQKRQAAVVNVARQSSAAGR